MLTSQRRLINIDDYFKNDELCVSNVNAKSICVAQKPIDSLHSRSANGEILIFGFNRMINELAVYSTTYCQLIYSIHCLNYHIDDHYLYVIIRKPMDGALHTGDGPNLYFNSLDAIYRSIKEPSKLKGHSRAIEPGSQIITSVGSVYDKASGSDPIHVLLQMPRGNIELITPRPFVLNRIITLLEHHEFKLAFDLSSRHRINFNVLCDYNIDDFLSSAEQFIDQFGNASNINQFLTTLENTNCITDGIYSDFICRPSSSMKFANEKKVKLICDRLSSVISNLKNQSEENDMLSCLINCDIMGATDLNVGLSNALLRLKKLHNDDRAQDQAFKSLLQYAFSANITAENLFDIALGNYDLNLTLMVSQKTGQDPKTALQILNRFKEYQKSKGQLYMNYQIDLYLHHFLDGLHNILAVRKTVGTNEYDDEIVKFVKRHALYKECLTNLALCDELHVFPIRLYTGTHDFYSEAIISTQKTPPIPFSDRYLSAGLVLLRANLKSGAVACFEKSDNPSAAKWMSTLPEEDNRTVDFSMSNLMSTDLGTVRSALSDPVFSDKLKCILMKEMDDMKAEIVNLSKELNRLNARVNHLRDQKLDTMKQSIDSAADNGDWLFRISDDFDVASSSCGSTSTSSTQLTSITARNRRRKEKKKEKMRKRLTNLMEGSKFEDIAIVTGPIYDCLVKIDNIAKSSRLLCELLSVFWCNDEAVGLLEESMASLRILALSVAENGWMMDTDEQNEDELARISEDSIIQMARRKMLLDFYSHLRFIDPTRRFPRLINQTSNVVILK
ncbi:hypothetical protein ACOME3_009997 [Neoechinorhynchus agilis]